MLKLSTKTKITIARKFQILIMLARRSFGAREKVVVRRRGIVWDLDLREGIDLAIYLFGGFELSTQYLYKNHISSGDTVIDIGANIGAHTLPFARLVGPQGKVVAFEPTQSAYAKLKRNISLNPLLGSRISSHQVVLLEKASANIPSRIYSSWPLQAGLDTHYLHGGLLQSTEGAKVSNLDRIFGEIGLNHVNFIKLDVDGYEPEVLLGALGIIGKFRPRILLEWAPYLLRHKDDLHQKALRSLHEFGYRARIAKSPAKTVMLNETNMIHTNLAEGASINLLLECPL